MRRTSHDRECVLLADRDVVHLGDCRCVAATTKLARVVRAVISKRRVVEGGLVEWYWFRHDAVTIDAGDECEGRGGQERR